MSDDFRIEVTPRHQELAARLGLATIDLNTDRLHTGLSEIAAAGMHAALAVISVQTRNLALALLLYHSVEDIRTMLERTILDARAGRDD